MSMPVHRRRFSYGEYLKWPEGERVEIIDGNMYAMTPAPSRIHQEIVLSLGAEFAAYLRGKACRAYVAPFDVRLPKGNEREDDIDTVVQPDLSVICDPSKLDDRGCKGAPDLIVEVISPGSLKLDMSVKKRLYERAGVREYWLAYPHERIIMVFSLDDTGHYDDGESYGKEDRIKVGIFEELVLDLSVVFAG